MAYPTPEQIAALRKYAAENGRTWKSQLLAEWERGTATGELQQVRNAFGPIWLVRFRFPVPAGVHVHDTDATRLRCLQGTHRRGDPRVQHLHLRGWRGLPVRSGLPDMNPLTCVRCGKVYRTNYALAAHLCTHAVDVADYLRCECCATSYEQGHRDGFQEGYKQGMADKGNPT